MFALALIGGWFVFLRPTFLGGPLGYVIVSGSSMEPGYQSGDFVITRSGDYEQGDIVAFHADDGPLVIHRIVGGGPDEGFVTQGDNRDTTDEWRPRDTDVVGKAWVHVPGFGDWVAKLREPLVAAAAVGGLAFIAVITTRTARKHRRGAAHMSINDSGTRFQPPSAFWGFAGFALVLTAVSAFVAVTAFSSSTSETETTERASFTQTTTFDYTILTAPSVLYPEGRIGPVTPETAANASDAPVYTRLAQGFDVGYAYQLDGDALAGLHGDYRVNLTVKAGDEGWSRSQELTPATQFEGQSFNGRVHVELGPLHSMIESIESETGVAANFYEIDVAIEVAVSGLTAEEPLDASQAPLLSFRLSRSRITPPDELVIRDRESLGDSFTRDKQLGVSGLSVPVDTARVASVAGTAGGLLVAGLVTLAIYSGFGQGEAARVRIKYGAMIIPVRDAGDEGNRIIEVESLADLGRLAQRDGGVILCQDLGDTRRYVVTGHSTSYEYLVDV